MRRRVHVLAASTLALLIASGALLWWSTARMPSLPVVPFPAPADAALVRIEGLLASDTAFRDDLVFLLAATLRDRCRPGQAGVLARMANRASLPVLAAVSRVTAADASLDRPIYQYIQHHADTAACDQPLQLPGAGGDALHVDIEQYARTFPDSYFDPQRSSEPRDFGGVSLAERAGNACNSVVYSVVPLGGVDWRCSSLRSNARGQVRELCEAALREQHGSVAGELDAAAGQAMQAPIVKAIAALPEECR